MRDGKAQNSKFAARTSVRQLIENIKHKRNCHFSSQVLSGLSNVHTKGFAYALEGS